MGRPGLGSLSAALFPLAAILFARGLAVILDVFRERLAHRYAALVALTLLSLALIPTALAARGGKFTIGGRPDADGGAAGAARLLKDAPYGTVLYDHWYSWHWHYQLFDSAVYVSWFPRLMPYWTIWRFCGRGPEALHCPSFVGRGRAYRAAVGGWRVFSGTIR